MAEKIIRSNGSKSFKEGKKAFEGRKNRFEIELNKSLNEFDSVSDNFEKKQEEFDKLCKKQARVSQMFQTYHLTSSSRRLSISGKRRSTFAKSKFNTLDEQVEELECKLKTFAGKTQKTAEGLHKFARRMDVYSSLLLSILDKIEKAKCMEDLPRLPLPSLDGTESISSLGIEELIEEWKELGLESTIKNILKQF